MFALYFDEPLQRARASDEALLHTTRQAVKTQRGYRFLSFWMRYSQGGARVMDWGGRYHSNRKAWQNDYSLKSSHQNFLILCLLTHSHVVLARQARF